MLVHMSSGLCAPVAAGACSLVVFTTTPTFHTDLVNPRWFLLLTHIPAHGKSAPFQVGYFHRDCGGPIRPITGRHSLSPVILYPLDHWAFLTVGLAGHH